MGAIVWPKQVTAPVPQAAAKNKAATPPKAKTATSAKPAPQSTAGFGRLIGKFFAVEPVRLDHIADEDSETRRFQRRLRIVLINAFVIMGLSAFLIIGIPFFAPVYRYYALNPQQQVKEMTALTMPNMTNNAVLSWSTNSITEIMTMGFGDYEQHLKQQRGRFTEQGWDSFARAFDKQKIGERFKQEQLVLTTVPSGAPVIVAHGVNKNHIYQWKVQMPVIMTYATNNDRNDKRKSIVELTIVRVPPETYPAGIAIENWTRAD